MFFLINYSDKMGKFRCNCRRSYWLVMCEEKEMNRKVLLVFLLIVMTLFVDATELKRNGWNLISVCQDMNRSEVNMSGIEEIQSQDGKSIYTGDWEEYSNLEKLKAGYGYWVKGDAGISFESGISSGKLITPLNRDGWNLMAACEDISSSDINLTALNIQEIQSQEGQSIYSGDWAAYSNLDALENGYGYWVQGQGGISWMAKRGLDIPSGFDYQTINNAGEIIETTFEDLTIKLFVDYNETANDQANHTGIVVRINGIDAPLMQIQDTYRGHNIVVGVYTIDGELVGVSDVTTVEMEGAGTFIDVILDDTPPPPVDIHPEIWLMGEGISVDENNSRTWWFGTNDVDSVRLAEGTPSFITLVEDDGAGEISVAQQSTSISTSNYRIEINPTVDTPIGYYSIEVIGINNDLGVEVNGTLNLFYGIEMPDIDFEQYNIELNQGESRSLNFDLYHADSVEIGRTVRWSNYAEVVDGFASINGDSIEIHPALDIEPSEYYIEVIARDSVTAGEVSRWIGVEVNPEGSNHRPDINLTIYSTQIDLNSTDTILATINATDIDGDVVSYGLSSSPSFIMLEDNNITYRSDATETQGEYSIEIYAEDSNGSRAYRWFYFELVAAQTVESNQPIVGLKPLYTTDSRLNYEIYGENDSRLFANGIDTGYQLVNGSTMIDFARNNGEVVSLELDINGEMSDETNLTLIEYPTLNINLNDNWSSRVVSIHRETDDTTESSLSSKRTLVQSSEETTSSHYSKYYYFTLEEAQNVTIDLNSSTDTYLLLLDGFGKNSNVIESNDDSNGTLNSHIETYLGAGTYTIEATTYAANQYGEFNLNVHEVDSNQTGNNSIPFTEDKVVDRTFYMGRWYDEVDKKNHLYSLSFNSDNISIEHWYDALLDDTSWTESWEYNNNWRIDSNGSLITREEHNITVHTWSNDDLNGSWYRCDLTKKYDLLNEFDDRYEVNASENIFNCMEIDDPTQSVAKININLSTKVQNRTEGYGSPHQLSSTSESDEPFSCSCAWITSMNFDQPQPYSKDDLREQGYDDVSIGAGIKLIDANSTILEIPTDTQVHIAHTWDNWHPALGLTAHVFENGDFNASAFLDIRDRYRDGQMMDYQVYIDSNHNALLDDGEEILCSENVLFEDLNNEFICNPSGGGEEPPSVSERELPLIIIRIEFDDYQFRSTESVWHDKIFGDTQGELNHYYNEISYGKFQFKEANESDGIANNGIITVHLDENHPGDVDDFVDRINSAVALANDYIDFSIYDKNHNGAISRDELQLMFLVAGGESATGVSPGIWAYQWCMYGGNADAPTQDGVKLMSCQDGGNFSRFGERQFSIDGPDASIGVIAHELGHAVFGLPDLYDVDYSSAGIGQFGLMSGGSWAKQPGDDYPGETPVHMTGWSKIYSGFVTPIEINETISNVELKGTSFSDYVLYKIETGIMGEYFLIENRAPSGYDMGLSSLDGTDNFTGGLSILHIDESQSGNSDENHKLVDIVEANNIGLDSAAHQGHINNLYFSGNSDSFTPTTTPNSDRYDGNSSGVSVTNISDAGFVMSVDVIIERGE